MEVVRCRSLSEKKKKKKQTSGCLSIDEAGSCSLAALESFAAPCRCGDIPLRRIEDKDPGRFPMETVSFSSAVVWSRKWGVSSPGAQKYHRRLTALEPESILFRLLDRRLALCDPLGINDYLDEWSSQGPTSTNPKSSSLSSPRLRVQRFYFESIVLLHLPHCCPGPSRTDDVDAGVDRVSRPVVLTFQVKRPIGTGVTSST